MVSKEDIKTAIGKLDLSKIKAKTGGVIKLEEVPKEKLDRIVHKALHCALNGPVGVNTKTTFPGLEGESCIKDDLSVSNSNWKAFVEIVVQNLDLNSEQIQDCYCIKNFGSVWPRCDLVFKKKSKDN